ncbi:MAG: SAM-dependent methyltransferase [Bacteroidota bacterium]
MAPVVGEIIRQTRHFLVENVRTTRRYISSLRLGIEIGDLTFQTLDKKTSYDELMKLMKPLMEGEDMGVISEAGMPCIADPGRIAVDFAHSNDIEVVPIPGPSSILLALIGSGLNGQQFTFHGYLPIDREQRTKRILSLQKEVLGSDITQIFMETPYRNNQLLTDLVSNLAGDLLLSIATNLTGDNESVRTKPISFWKAHLPDLHKKPTIFSLGRRKS